MNPIRWIDRLLFACLLLIALQLPILSDHYRQYLSGYIDGLNEQVETWQQLAKEFKFDSVDDFITHLQGNADPIVAKDAQTKRDTLIELHNKQAGLAVLNSDNYPQHWLYIFSPNNFSTLSKVIENFRPSLPLTPTAIVYSVVLAIILDAILLMPFWGAKRFMQRRKHAPF